MASRKEHEINKRVMETIKARRRAPRIAVTKPYDPRFRCAPTIMADKELWEALYDMVDGYMDDV